MDLRKRAGSWLLAGLFGVWASLAQAAVSLPLDEGPITTEVTNDVVAPDGQAMPAFSFTLDAPFDMVDALLNVQYSDTLMTFHAGASTLDMVPAAVPLAQVPVALQLDGGAAFTVSPLQDDPGLFSAFDNPGAFFTVLAGTYVFSPVFDLLSAFVADMQRQVTVLGDLVAATGAEPAMFDGVATVTAASEPTSWSMVLGGLDLLPGQHASPTCASAPSA